jgi:hypothetical protein
MLFPEQKMILPSAPQKCVPKTALDNFESDSLLCVMLGFCFEENAAVKFFSRQCWSW